MSDALFDRIAAAKDLPELDSVRVSVLGKQGEITAKLKSLGSMDPSHAGRSGAEDSCAPRAGHERDRRP